MTTGSTKIGPHYYRTRGSLTQKARSLGTKTYFFVSLYILTLHGPTTEVDSDVAVGNV
jgi:hypothetical protein